MKRRKKAMKENGEKGHKVIQKAKKIKIQKVKVRESKKKKVKERLNSVDNLVITCEKIMDKF